MQFWDLTPYLTGLIMAPLQNRRIALAWLTANFSRRQKLSKLDTLLIETAQKDTSGEGLKQALAAFGRK